MFLVFGLCFLILLSITLFMLWAHERMTTKKITPRAKVLEYWTGDERREHKRFDKDLEIEYTIEEKPHLKNGRAINVSRGGMMLLIDEKLTVGYILDMKVYIPENKKFFEVEAEVVWTKDKEEKDALGKRLFYSGVKFIAIKEPYGSHFIQYMDSLYLHG